MILQAAALPVHEGKVCLVTSRSGARWVIPKGCLEPGVSEAEIAVQQAWEEAGLSGQIGKAPLGSYCYRKWGDDLTVAVFLLEASEIARDWPERATRQRVWLGPAEAVERLAEADLQHIVRKFFTMNEG